MLNPVAMPIITNTFPYPAERAVGRVQGNMFGLSIAAGPIADGALLNSASWRDVFWINIQIGVAACPHGAVRGPVSHGRRPVQPPAGAVLRRRQAPHPLTSIPGAVIELSLAPAGGDVDGVTWADALQLPAGLPANLNSPACWITQALQGSAGHSRLAVTAVRIPLAGSGRCYSGRPVEAESFCPGQHHRRCIGAPLGQLPGNRG